LARREGGEEWLEVEGLRGGGGEEGARGRRGATVESGIGGHGASLGE
jgi:hypothetical protein